MLTTKLPMQNGNSCAAHCTAIAIWELTKCVPSQKLVEEKLWPAIQFVDKGGINAVLSAQRNSDPRLIVNVVKKQWPSVNVKLLCDQVQKETAIAFVEEAMQGPLNGLFNVLSNDAKTFPVRLEEHTFYNCSYTMHNAAQPSKNNFDGLHNILVTYQGGKVHYYNSNENKPDWKETFTWKKLENQNSRNHSYVFTGVAVAIL